MKSAYDTCTIQLITCINIYAYYMQVSFISTCMQYAYFMDLGHFPCMVQSLILLSNINFAQCSSLELKPVHNMTKGHMHCVVSSLHNSNIFINLHFFVSRRKNTIQRKARIGSKSILAFGCIVVSMTQHNAGLCILL